MEQNAKAHLVQLHIAVLLFAGTALFSKLIPLGALDITFYRVFIAAVALGCYLKFSKERMRLNSLRDYRIALTLGVFVGLHWYTYFDGMQRAGVAVGMLAFFTYPMTTVFIEAAYKRSWPHWQDIVSAIFVFIGVLLIIPELSLENGTTLGIAIGVLSGIFFALRNTIHHRYFHQYSGTKAMFYQVCVTAVMFALFIDVKPMDLGSNNIGLLLLAGAVFTALPHTMFAHVLRHMSATTVSMISSLLPFYTVILAAIILGEQPDTRTLVGGGFIVLTALYQTLIFKKK